MDDGFQWIDELEAPWPGQLWSLVNWVADGEHHRVEAAVPGIIESSRSQHLPWIEVFARNMRLRSVVLHREDTRAGLPEAVSLTERASHADMADCPQTICVAHALCAAYGLRDGPGHASIRQKVSKETLERIDPRRVCFLCITNEHADALIDGGEPEQALVFLEAQTQRRRSMGEAVDPDDFGFREVTALLTLGRLEEAKARLEAAHEPQRGESWLRTWRQWNARLLAEQGDPGAVEFLSSLEEIIEDGGFLLHFETLDALDRHNLFEQDEAIRHRTVLGTVAVERGVARSGIDALAKAAETLIGQGERSLALAALDRATSGLGDLEDPSKTTKRLDALRKAAEDLKASPEGTMENAMGGQLDVDAVMRLANVWRTFGFSTEATAFIQDRSDAAPNDEDLFRGAAEALLQQGDLAALEIRLSRPPQTEDGPVFARIYKARAARKSDPGSAISLLQEVLESRPGWLATADELGILCFSQQRYEDALAAWTHGAEGMERPNGFDWDIIAAATMLDRWDLVRASAISLKFPIEPGNAPIDQDLGIVAVRFDDDSNPFLAQRMSPLTARIHSLRRVGEPQRHGQVVLFHPEVLNAEERAATEEWIPPEHRAVCAAGELTEAYVCVAIDGLHPGEEVLTTFLDTLEQDGITAQRGSGDDYQLDNPDTGSEQPAIYLVVAIQRSRADALIEHILQLPGVITFPELLRLADREDEAVRHDALQTAWGM